MLLHLKDIRLSLGEHTLLNGVNLIVNPNEKIAILGRNGAGKSSLLKLIAGHVHADEGERICRKNLVLSFLEQEVLDAFEGSVLSCILSGAGEVGELLLSYLELSDSHQPENQRQLEQLCQQLEHCDGWRLQVLVETLVSHLQLDAKQDYQAISGGMKRRVSLARALAIQPDILLLDEPTNHLDIDSIVFLERFLKSYKGTVLFVTHDRSFLQNVSTRIIELDRGAVHSYDGNYQAYLIHKGQRLNEEQRHQALFDKKLNQEEQWIRQGIKARRTRNEGRVKRLKAMREERKKRLAIQDTISFQNTIQDGSGKLVINAEQLGYKIKNKTIIDTFSSLVLKGDKIGILGPNGCGKTTLLKVLLGQYKPTEGKIKLGSGIKLAYFDQMRSTIDLNQSVLDNVAQGRQSVEVNGQTRHVISYLQDFLFEPSRINAPANCLSGGEKNRLLLAKLLIEPSNLIVMDEPTNDLDIETMEYLENWLVQYKGTLLIVSHDRAFLDNVATTMWVYEGEGHFNEYLGGYEDYHEKKKIAKPTKPEPSSLKPRKNSTLGAKKLSYNEQRELSLLPNKIDQLEGAIATMHQEMQTKTFYQKPSETIAEFNEKLQTLEAELEALLLRWEDLESKK